MMYTYNYSYISVQIHFIFRHKNPVTGKYEEKHAKAVDMDMGFFDDKKTHIFRLSKFYHLTIK